jgi:hypothetical protein
VLEVRDIAGFWVNKQVFGAMKVSSGLLRGKLQRGM